MEEEEQEQEYVHFSPMRFCRTDDGDLDSSGTYEMKADFEQQANLQQVLSKLSNSPHKATSLKVSISRCLVQHLNTCVTKRSMVFPPICEFILMLY